MITITLPNTEGSPLRLACSLLFSGEAKLADGKRLLRLSVYRPMGDDTLAADMLAYSVAFESTWKHEVERHVSRLVHGREIVAELRDLDLTSWVRGFPDAPRFDGKHQKLMAEISDRWAALVSSALVHLRSE
jgi:hypothetical protein